MIIPVCPICGKRNVTPAHFVGHAGRGKPKTLTAEQRQDQAARMAAVNARIALRKEAKP